MIRTDTEVHDRKCHGCKKTVEKCIHIFHKCTKKTCRFTCALDYCEDCVKNPKKMHMIKQVAPAEVIGKTCEVCAMIFVSGEGKDVPMCTNCGYIVCRSCCNKRRIR